MRPSLSELPRYERVAPLVDVFAFIVKTARRAVHPANDTIAPARDEATHIAHDLNLEENELRRLSRRGHRAADELYSLLDVLRIDARALADRHPEIMRDLQRVCTVCGEKKRCRHDVAVAAAPDTYRDYCPNVLTLDAVLKDVPERR